MNPPQVYMCSPSWTLLPPPSRYHPSGSSQCTSPKHPVSCIEPGLATRFIHDILHVSMPFSQIFPPSPSLSFSLILYDSSSKENRVIAFSTHLLSSMCLRPLIYKKGIVCVSCTCVLSCSVVSDCSPIDCGPLGFSVLGILEARILEQVAISLTVPKPLTVWITTNCGKFLKS